MELAVDVGADIYDLVVDEAQRKGKKCRLDCL